MFFGWLPWCNGSHPYPYTYFVHIYTLCSVVVWFASCHGRDRHDGEDTYNPGVKSCGDSTFISPSLASVDTYLPCDEVSGCCDSGRAGTRPPTLSPEAGSLQASQVWVPNGSELKVGEEHQTRLTADSGLGELEGVKEAGCLARVEQVYVFVCA